MPAQLIDFKASQPSNQPFVGVLPGGVILPHSVVSFNSVTLADLGIFLTVGPQNRVDLLVEVGIEGASVFQATMDVQFIRDGHTIFDGFQSIDGVPSRDLFTFKAVDFNVPAGFHVYTVALFNISLEVFTVLGPVTFTGAAYALTP